MKKIPFLLFLGLFCSLSCSAATPYVGASVGYLVDSEDPIYGAHFGAELFRSGAYVHCLEGEVLHSTSNDRGVRFNVTPLMVNYRFGIDFPQGVYCNFGAGVGVTKTSVKYWIVSDSDKAFTYQLLGSVGYMLSKEISIEAAVRYIDIGSAKMVGVKADVGDDVSFELGFRCRF